MLNRRGFLSGLAAALAAPAIVKYASLMPVKVMPEGLTAERVHDLVGAMRAMLQPDYFMILRPSLYDQIQKEMRMAEFERSFNARIIRQEPMLGTYEGVTWIN